MSYDRSANERRVVLKLCRESASLLSCDGGRWYRIKRYPHPERKRKLRRKANKAVRSQPQALQRSDYKRCFDMERR